jgi:putative FmdB family regulatory protein
MPTYEYQCSQCQHRLEAFEKITDIPLTDCPACRNPALQRLVSAAGFQLKGSGWYATDFRNKGKSPASSSSKTEESGTAGSQDKSDSKTTDNKSENTAVTES